jgi:hypothetical protein
MTDCIDNTISGFNEQIRHIRQLEEQFPEQEIVIALTMFNSEIKDYLFLEKPAMAPTLTTEIYRPSGNTALLDAIGITTEKLEKIQLETNLSIPTTVVVVVLTDGYENSSRVFKLSDIRRTISRLEETGHWTFSFMGATLDAVDVADQMNFQRQNSMSFDKRTMKEEVWNKTWHFDVFLLGEETRRKKP